MPRKARIDAPEAIHHIIVRGTEQRKIFKDDTDRVNFLDRLGKVLSETGTRRFAWALIPNDRVAEIFFIKPAEIFLPGKQPIKVKARSLFCYWSVRELGLTMADLAPKLNISQPAVSMRDL